MIHYQVAFRTWFDARKGRETIARTTVCAVREAEALTIALSNWQAYVDVWSQHEERTRMLRERTLLGVVITPLHPEDEAVNNLGRWILTDVKE